VLLDFGLAKGYAGQASVVTTSASIFGYTPNYAPLEQVQGLGTDARSDIYALAATLFHLLTNVKPPDALSRAGALVNGQPDPLPPANRVASQVSTAVANVLSKSMSQKRDDRFASAVLMREAFRLASTSSAELGDAATVLVTSAATSSGGSTVATDKSTKLKGGQTKAFGNEAQTLIAGDATEVRGAPERGETVTAVRAASGARGSRRWLPAALLLLVIASGAGAFFVYRARHNQAQNPTPVSPSPAPTIQAEATPSPANANSESGTAVKTTEPKSERSKVESTVQRATTTKPSTEKSTTSTPAQNENAIAHDPNHGSDRGRSPAGPLPTPYDPGRNVPGRQPGHPPRVNETPGVRTFPNGTKVVTQPDGTRVVTMPNGTTRVFPPGEKPNQKRRP
jgi:hypothetical protein